LLNVKLVGTSRKPVGFKRLKRQKNAPNFCVGGIISIKCEQNRNLLVLKC